MASLDADTKAGLAGEAGGGSAFLKLSVDEVVERTVPRGRSADDRDPVPGVDPAVWLLHVRFDRSGDPATLAALVREYDRYARALAWRFHRDREPIEDLEQVAREALVVALRRFDPSRGLPFPAYASPTITGALRRHYRDRGWSLRVPRRVHDITVAARATSERLTGEIGRAPTVGEVAEAIGIGVADLLDAQEAAHARETASIDAVVDGSQPALADRLGAVDVDLAGVEDHLALAAAVADLEEGDRQLLGLYYFEEWNQSQIGQHLGISQMQVSRRLGSTLRRLRTRLDGDGVATAAGHVA